MAERTTPNEPIDWARFAAVVAAGRRFVLTSHARPDCDALGSELGLAAVLESLGKEVRIVNDDPVPPNLAFIDPQRKIQMLAGDVAAAADCDVMIVLDTSAWAQLGAMADVVRSTRAAKLVIDHHASGDDLGAEAFADPTAEATGRLVVDAADALDIALTPEMAAPLLAAIATDTGWFRFASTSGDTLRCAARLIDAGARPPELYRDLYERDSLARLHLVGRVLSRVTVLEEGRLAAAAIFREDFQATGASRSDTEDIINMSMTVAGTEVAVLLIEEDSGEFKISLRSRFDVDVRRVAEQFGGGGHKQAAGARVSGPYSAARQRVLDSLSAAMR